MSAPPPDDGAAEVRVEVDVILPVLDEAASLPWVLGRIPAGMRAIVVDNGSTDGSAEVARALGVQVVHEPRRGFGAACHAGLLAATAPVVAYMDADSSFDPADLVAICQPIRAGTAGLVLGARVPAPGAWPWHARLANRVLARRIRAATGVRLTDLGPMRAIDRQQLLALGMQDRSYGWPLEMVLRATRAGLVIVERPVTYQPRVGRSKVTGTVRGTTGAVRDMTRLLRRYA
jgi:glycosyltransferase involved in cell wall biosynthesis